MKNFWATSAMGLGIGLFFAGLFILLISPILAIIIGTIPVFFGYLALKKLKEDPNVGGKPKAMIGIFMGATIIIIGLFNLLQSLLGY